MRTKSGYHITVTQFGYGFSFQTELARECPSFPPWGCRSPGYVLMQCWEAVSDE